MHPVGGHIRPVLVAITPASIGNAIAGIGVVAGTYAWVETTGATIGIIVAIVSGLGYLYRTLIRPLVHVVRETRDKLEKLDELDGMKRDLAVAIIDIAALKHELVPKEKP